MSKKIQIDYELFIKLLRYFNAEHTQILHDDIKNGLNAKLDALAKREIYTISKTAKTEEERNKALNDYLDLLGVPQNFRG